MRNPATVEVRIASDDELPLVYEIMRAAFEEYRGVLDPPSGALVETLDDARRSTAKGGAVLGFVEDRAVGSARFERRTGHVYCWRIAVLPVARGRGVATAMLEHIHGEARRLGYREVRLATREVMESNLRYYRKLGYEVVSRAPHPSGGGIVVELAKRLL
ncbi:MAG: GNAT family N-acetyltransferase [Fimbriimonadaceae bacterium]|nr:GNAT family N-acetyltransferase [Fimbriimonadaceae bacterium]